MIKCDELIHGFRLTVYYGVHFIHICKYSTQEQAISAREMIEEGLVYNRARVTLPADNPYDSANAESFVLDDEEPQL